jgi:hypothetical protein
MDRLLALYRFAMRTGDRRLAARLERALFLPPRGRKPRSAAAERVVERLAERLARQGR